MLRRQHKAERSLPGTRTPWCAKQGRRQARTVGRIAEMSRFRLQQTLLELVTAVLHAKG